MFFGQTCGAAQVTAGTGAAARSFRTACNSTSCIICDPCDVLAVLFFVLSLSVGRFYVPFDQVAAILASNFIELPITWDASMYNVVMVIRLPRVLGDILVGVALAVSGAAYQGGLSQRSRLARSPRRLAGRERGRVPCDPRASDAWRHGGGDHRRGGHERTLRTARPHRSDRHAHGLRRRGDCMTCSS